MLFILGLLVESQATLKLQHTGGLLTNESQEASVKQVAIDGSEKAGLQLPIMPDIGKPVVAVTADGGEVVQSFSDQNSKKFTTSCLAKNDLVAAVNDENEKDKILEPTESRDGMFVILNFWSLFLY